MKVTLCVLLFFGDLASAWCDGSLYIAKQGEQGAQSIEKGNFVSRIPVSKVPITDAVLRHDTDDTSILWLELHMKDYRDPGDHIYYFQPASKKHWECYVRASHVNKDGCLWAIRFGSKKAGRSALAEVAKSYNLRSTQALDLTKD